MHVVELAEGLVLYQFDPPADEVEGLNFMALIEGGRALFLDTGYAEHMALALDDIAGRGAACVGAVVSHYHPDHDGGLSLLGGVEIWAGEAWRATANAWRAPGGAASVEPTRLVSGPTELRFGRRRLELCPLPGHSDDSLAVVIDDAWLYVADAVLTTNDGRPLLPSVHSRPVSRHLEAVDWLAGRAGLAFVPGHGAVMADRAWRERDLRNRRLYLAALCRAEGPVSFEEATAGCDPPFLGREWHEHNYR